MVWGRILYTPLIRTRSPLGPLDSFGSARAFRRNLESFAAETEQVARDERTNAVLPPPLRLPTHARTLDAFPLPHELRTLLTSRATVLATIQQHQDLLSRLSSILSARAAGNAQMHLDVDLGMGYIIEGVV